MSSVSLFNAEQNAVDGYALQKDPSVVSSLGSGQGSAVNIPVWMFVRTGLHNSGLTA